VEKGAEKDVEVARDAERERAVGEETGVVAPS